MLVTCATVLIGGGLQATPRVHPGLEAAAASVSRPLRSSFSVRIARPLPIRSRPASGRVVGWMPASSRYFHQPMLAWVLRTARNGRFGRVAVPYTAVHRQGWISLRGLRRTRTAVRVYADLSRHLLVVRRRGRVVVRVHAATGASSTPTPTGRYFVTDRVAFSAGSSYGSFAFGLSGIQSHLPSWWSGGDQLAIHGTDEPWTIGQSVSAGCLRVSEKALGKLRTLLRLGTPVVIRS